jgi:hypothetical protein
MSNFTVLFCLMSSDKTLNPKERKDHNILYSFSSVTYVWVRGTKSYRSLNIFCFLQSNFLRNVKFQVAAHVLQK